MITSRRSFRACREIRPTATTTVPSWADGIVPRGVRGIVPRWAYGALVAFVGLSSTWGADSQRYANERIAIDHARPVARAQKSASPDRRQTQGTRRAASPIAQAAQGRIPAGPPQPPELVGGDVQPVGYAEHYGSQCGPVCDCGACSEPACGIEPYLTDPGCGIDGIEVIEAGCGIEPSGSFEVGCGIGSAMDNLGPVFGQRFDAGCGIEEVYIDDPACGLETVEHCNCDACCEVDAIPVHVPFFRINWNRLDFFAGVQGYKGPLNFARIDANNANLRSGSGSFGFYEGFNEGRSLKPYLYCDIASQFGVRATQSNLSGAQFTNETRNQVFVTGGLFRRVDYGLQYGLVVDYLNDDWYFRGHLVQLRGELSWVHACHAWGFQFMSGVNDDQANTTTIDSSGNRVSELISFESTDQYRFFYRRMLQHSGSWNAFAGWTDNSDGILGADISLPLRQRLVLSTGATYLIPNEGKRSGGHAEESWNLAMGLVYRVGGPKGTGRYCRPLFDVADNGTFMVDRK